MLEDVRRRWSGRLVLKGLVSPEDAKIARAAGVAALIVSNHGGRQLDGTVSPMRVLAEVVEAAGELTVMMDSGVRRGTDVLKALALGAKFVFVGRPFNYAASVAGEAGVARAIELLSGEVRRNMRCWGYPRSRWGRSNCGEFGTDPISPLVRRNERLGASPNLVDGARRPAARGWSRRSAASRTLGVARYEEPAACVRRRLLQARAHALSRPHLSALRSHRERSHWLHSAHVATGLQRSAPPRITPARWYMWCERTRRARRSRRRTRDHHPR